MKTIKKDFFLFLIAIAISSYIYSQNQVDALRYSYTLFEGTARNISMSGAFSALGADFSVLSTNPAGIAVYKKSEFVLTPALSYINTKSDYLNNKTDDYKYNLHFSNWGFVFTNYLGDTQSEKHGWKSIHFGVGINRLKSFAEQVLIEGLNMDNSILDAYWAEAQGIHFSDLNPFDTKLAFNTYLLDTAGGPANYVQAHYGGALQRKIIETSGGLSEMVLSFGGNYNERLYMGATVGLASIRYKELAKYMEIDKLDTLVNFNQLTITDGLTTTGSGINFKAGLIFRATDWARLSLAFHTPTFFQMHDNYYREMSSDLDTLGKFKDKSPRGLYDYNLVTPLRLIGGMAFVIPDIGLISAEYEMVDYSQARLRPRGIVGDFTDANEIIRDNYTVASNIRVGTEWIVNPFSLRAGYALYGTPYKTEDLNDASMQFITGGVGYRQQSFFIDLGYKYSIKNEKYYIYSIAPEAAKIEQQRHQLFVSVGFKF